MHIDNMCFGGYEKRLVYKWFVICIGKWLE